MPLSPSATRELLLKLDHRPKKKLGQNFLIDGNIVQKSIAMAELREGMDVLEVGPGLGTLTQELLNHGQRVHAVEFDAKLTGNLRERFAPSINQGQLQLIQGDAVKEPLGTIPEDSLEYLVVANLPYAISSAWMEALLATRQIPKRMVLMLQKEAVERMWAQPNGKNFNALSVFLHGSFLLNGTHSVSRQCFHPVPQIDSLLIRMDRLEKPYLFSDRSRALIRKIFTQRRKQIGSLAKKEKPEIQEKLLDWLSQNDLPTTLRPEQIPPEAWRTLAESLKP